MCHRAVPGDAPAQGGISGTDARLTSIAVRVRDRFQPGGAHRQPGGGGRHRPDLADSSCDPDPAAQARQCLAIIERALTEAGATVRDVVRTRTYLIARDDWESIGRVHGEVFGDVRPASTMIVVAGLIDPRWRVEIEADAIIAA